MTKEQQIAVLEDALKRLGAHGMPELDGPLKELLAFLKGEKVEKPDPSIIVTHPAATVEGLTKEREARVKEEEAAEKARLASFSENQKKAKEELAKH